MRNLLASSYSVIRFLFSWPCLLQAAPRRIRALRVLLLAAVLPLLLYIASFVAFIVVSSNTSRWTDFFASPYAQILLGLYVTWFIVVSYALKLWSHMSMFPDVDQAWSKVTEALRQRRVDLKNTPVFLMLGSTKGNEAHALMQAAGFEVDVRGVPQGRVPLQCFADERAVFVFTHEVGSLSRFNAAATQSVDTPDLPNGGAPWVSTMTPGPDKHETGVADSYTSGDITGTVVPPSHTLRQSRSASLASPISRPTLSREVIAEASSRLSYLCKLLSREREPHCPLNGVMTLVPARSLEGVSYTTSTHDLPEAISRDLHTIREATKLNCPVSLLVTDMDKMAGFAELMRRIGSKHAKNSRFGKGFNVWETPTKGKLDAFSATVIGVFEDWVYTLFREEKALLRQGNLKLYSLLCTMRSKWNVRLRSVLINGFGADDEVDPKLTMFSGCYFSATGDTADRQAFVRSALEKMIQQEDELMWTPEAIREDRLNRRIAHVAMCCNVIVLAIVGVVLSCWLSSN